MLSSRRRECTHTDRPAFSGPPWSVGIPCPMKASARPTTKAYTYEAWTHIRCRGIPLQVWLDGLVLLVEVRQVWYQVLDNVGVWQGVDLRVLVRVGRNAAWFKQSALFSYYQLLLQVPYPGNLLTQACQSVHAVDVHRTATADTLSATPAEGQGRVQLVLDPHQRVEDHGPGLVEVESVSLHPGLLGRLVRVPSVDLEGFHARCLGSGAGAGIGLLDLGVGFGDGGHGS